MSRARSKWKNELPGLRFAQRKLQTIAMHLECPACHHLLEFSAEAPSFCAYCGKAIEANGGTTIDYDPEATTPPSETSMRTQDSVPESVGGYRILRPLGKGGMGTVYEAEDASSGCHVALKLIGPEFVSSQDAVERFRQEGRLASAIAHPRCVFVFAVDEEAGQPYIAMELMPGATLHDLVMKRGPLPVEEAVAKILDVIDGLEEVHRLGVVHRDIKPSNCFLEADGRVKIGDFGLSKSLVQTTHLTKTGLFLGTPLYASPEQIKLERVDQQSDVYAVAATLYFLLTGRAPHQTGDTNATLARIISDPAASMRFLRPKLPAELDRVVLRGLERDRKRRWKNLEEFRTGLAPFVRRQFPISSVGVRVGAYVVDLLLFWFLGQVAKILLIATAPSDPLRPAMIGTIAEDVVWLAYFTLLEGLWGCSLGKRLLGLRVCSVTEGAGLGVARALWRTLVFHVLVNLGWPIAAIYVTANVSRLGRAILGNLGWLWFVVGIGIIGSTMRKRHGYRALHDLLSGSRVVRLPWTARQRKWRQPPQELATFRPEGLPERIDQFIIKGAFSSTLAEDLLFAEDAVLNRKVWLWLRPQSAAPLSEARRRMSRPTRLRWLDGGQAEGRQWDAFLAAPAGWTLPNLLALENQLSWAEGRPLLEQLTEELVAAGRDGTLPSTLTVDRVWIQTNGRIHLLEMSLGGVQVSSGGSARPDQEAALSLLREVASLTLEGRSPPTGEEPALQAPVPPHAALVLNRLLRMHGPSFDSVEAFRTELVATQDKPAEVTTAHRRAQLALLTMAVCLPLLLMFALGLFLPVVETCNRIVYLQDMIAEDQRILTDLQTEVRRDFVFSLLQPNPLGTSCGLVRLRGDMDLSELLQRRAEEHAARETIFRRSAGRIASACLPFFQLAAENRRQSAALTESAAEDSRKVADRAIHAPEQGFVRSDWKGYTIFYGCFPLICVVSAFLLHGGLTFRLAGIALVRANGRKAPRIRCAWRALLVWAPIAGLLAMSVWLHEAWLAAWYRQSADSFAWASWLAWLCSSLALGLLPLYAGLALWRPDRSVHDRLAGTYLVPR